MFEFLLDMGNYESRKVGKWETENGEQMVSTVRVSDGQKAYETAFQHPDYNDGKMVIVEAYDTHEEAVTGHEKWEQVMTAGPLPDALRDCCNAGVAQLLDVISEDEPGWNVYPRRSQSNGDGNRG